ncbi:MAG: hypothetical protein N3G19_02740 [Candidatus Pacearchaeota archaeon]|nr:hypothetical protein [Candidatus Pacearchaeota archaeon]
MNLFKFYPIEPLLEDKDFIIHFYKEQKGKRNIDIIINELTENFCYDRDFCKKHNIDYCNITRRDILNIRRHIIKVLKESAPL